MDDNISSSAEPDFEFNLEGDVDLSRPCNGWHVLNMWYYLGPMIFIGLCLSFMKRRTRLGLHILGGRPGLVYPINFIDQRGGRWKLASLFGIYSYQVLDLFLGNLFWSPPLAPNMSWLSTFILVVNIIIVTVLFHPLPVCLQMWRYLPLNFLGLAITIYYMVMTFMSLELCPIDPQADTFKQHTLVQAVLIPVYLSYVVLLIVFIYHICHNTKRLFLHHRGAGITSKQKPISRDIRYLEILLKRNVPPEPVTLKEKIIHWWKRRHADASIHSPRVVCTMVVATFVIYKLVFLGAFFLDNKVDEYEREIERRIAIEAVNGTVTLPFFDITMEEVRLGLYVIKKCLIAANIGACLIQVFNIYIMKRKYETHFKLLVKGHHEIHQHIRSGPATLLAGAMRFSGYQVGYILYGYLTALVMLTLLFALIAYMLVLPIMYKTSSPFIDALKNGWPAFIVGILIYISPVILSKFALLQDRGKYLLLDNRRVYHIASFFFFFFNVVIGLMSCLKRVVITTVVSVFMLSRTDVCLLLRGLERLDSGHRAYIGMLLADVNHNHPLLKAAIEIMQERVENTDYRASKYMPKYPKKFSKHIQVCPEAPLDVESPEKKLRRKFARNRWFKAITLLNNPTLTLRVGHKKLLKKIQALDDKAKVPVFELVRSRQNMTVDEPTVTRL